MAVGSPGADRRQHTQYQAPGREAALFMNDSETALTLSEGPRVAKAGRVRLECTSPRLLTSGPKGPPVTG